MVPLALSPVQLGRIGSATKTSATIGAKGRRLGMRPKIFARESVVILPQSQMKEYTHTCELRRELSSIDGLVV